MSEATQLTLAYLEKRPMAAARALASLEPETAAAFLDQTPTRQAVEILTHTGPWSASRILLEMQSDSAAAVLRELDFRHAVVMLRFVPSEARPDLLQAAPARLRRDLLSSLSYPEETVGAHMTTRVLAMTSTHTVADAMREMGKADLREGDPETLYVTDRQRRLLGVVTGATLLHHPAQTVLEEIADDSINRISARSRLQTVVHLEAWDRFTALPVIGRRRHLVGALPRAALRRLDAEEMSGPLPAGSSIPRAMGSAFLLAVSELARLLTEEPTTPMTRK